jgi:uncharacterized repeat protein (TIGR01451 family)
MSEKKRCAVVHVRSKFAGFAFALLVLLLPPAAHAATTLTVAPIAWNVVGLDSNSPATGPGNFPVGARVCSSVATTNVGVTFVWDSANAFVDLRAGSLTTISIPSIGAGQCADAYFEVAVVRTAAAFDTTRRYHITAADGSGTASTVTPREIYVEHLISQNRNSVTDVKFGTTLANLVSVPAGGAMDLVVGNTYLIQLLGGTATQGYNQFEAFINFPNTIFQIAGVTTSYSADNSPFVANPNDKLYADACLWENDPNSPNYRSCVGGDFKAGGSNVVTTYTIKVISGGGTSQTLNTLLDDFSGSSYHYNADFATGARVANVIDPTSATISKSFSPNPASLNGVSVLTLTLTNPNAGTLSGYNFVDNLPANLTVAATPAATTTGCGAPSLTAAAGSSSISFSNGTLAANSNCVIKVNVTPSATGSLVNTTGHLFIDTTDTGHNATATLTVNNAPPPGTGLCGVTMAAWTVPAGTTANPPDLAGGLPTTKAANVGTATLIANVPADTAIIATGGHGDTTSWRTNGYKNDGNFIEFTIDTSNYTNVQFSFWVANPSSSNGPNAINLTINNGGGFGAPTALAIPPIAFTHYTINATGLTNPSGNTVFRITPTGANNDATGASLNYDDILFTGCMPAVKPALTKAFSPSPIAVNAISTLTFTLTNTNAAPLTGAAFTDSLPSGVQVAATPAASTTCGGTWAPAAAATSLTFSGGTIPTNASCTVSVNIIATTAGPHGNVSGTLSTTESGTTISSVGTANLTAILPPVIAKQFSPSPIIAGGTSTLTFTITNPNQNDALAGVAFGDTFPASPGAMTVAGSPAASTSGCGAPAFNPAAGAGSVSFSGGTIAGGGTCIVKVNVTAPVAGTYNNSSGNVSYIINAATVNGNTASGALTIGPPHPTISLGKQISLSASGPWMTFLPLNAGPVFYRFTVENTGDVPLNPISITDDTLNVSSCNAGFASVTLPVAVAANDNHIVTCVVGPVSIANGSHTNTAHATGTFSGTPHDSANDTATYATTGLTLDKTSVESTYLAAGNLIHYSYLVTNSGFAPLQGPVTVADNKATVTCPAVSTVGDLDNFLDPAESITCSAIYTITAADVANVTVTNTATATVQSVNSNSDSVTVTLATAADVSMVKTLTTAGPFITGQSITYTLFVANGGPSTATNVQVTDTPTNLTITNVSGGGCAALPCTIPSLGVGANANITVIATINAPGAFDNSASVSATQPDPNLGNNTDNSGNGGLTGASADVSVVKTLTTAGPYTIGQIVSYTIVVANAGPSTATNVQVTDTPTNLSITNVSGGGCAALPCTIASLASGANVTINVTATINAAGSFDNTATVSANEPDPNSSNNTDNSGNGGLAAASADVSVVKTLTTSGPFTVNQSITYTLVVANAGPSVATNVQVTDTPTNLTITNVTGGGCAALPCTIASLGVGSNVTVTVIATITAAGSFDNTANVSANEPDPNVTNNTDSIGNGGTAAASADVSIVKTLTTAGPYTIGQSIIYTLFIANAGPSPATNIQVSDIPTNLSITGVSGACGSLPCTISTLASGANTTINVTATITATGSFDNSATVSATEPDPNSSNNTDSTGNGGTAAASADVSIVKTLTTAGPYSINQSITYTLFVANAGPSIATNVQITDTPSNLTITNVTGGGCAALPCTIASLGVGANATITVTATITATGAFDNSATVSATEPDPNTSNNTDSTGNGGTAAASADVSIVKTLTTAGPFTIGQSITYTLFVANAGPSVATNVQITDTPSNLTITNVTGGGCTALPCTIASLGVGANATVTVTATITAAGGFDNSATVSATEPDPNSSNNTDSTGNGGTAAASADVSIVKTLTTAGPYAINQSITYTLLVANAGPSIATNVQVTDTPSNLTIANVTGGGCAALPCTIASLGVGANVTITVTATIKPADTFDNSATVAATEPDPNTTNNTDSTGNGSTVGEAADVSVVKTLTTAGPFIATQTISYTLFVANAGASAATNVQVIDTPSNLTITSVSGGGCTALPCTLPALAAGANVTIDVTATINAQGSFDNTATVSATEPDTDLSNNTDNSGNGGEAGPAADVSIVKTLITSGPFTAGQSISYTLVVANAGPSTATSIQVTDTPTNLTITNVGGACISLPCTITLASGANITITVTATITTVGAFDNSATATGAEPDPNTGNNTDNTGNGGLTGVSADVSVVKTLTTAGPFTIGQSISYTIVVANAGPSPATNVQVTDTPTNLSITTVSGGGCAALPCTIASLASGANVTINVTATITAAGAFDNSSTVSAATPDPNSGNNTDNTGNGGTVAASADVSMVKTLTTAGPFTIGQIISYTLVVANAGPSTATSVHVTDTPTNLTITTVTGACTSLPCTIASLASGASVTINVTGSIFTFGAFDNSATASATEPDPNSGNNTDNTGNGGIVPSANLSLVKTLNTAGPFTKGQTLSYTIVVANAGPSTATNIQVNDTPTQLTMTNVNGGGCNAFPCNIASLASGANVIINVTATINAAGTFNNFALVTATEPDPNSGDNVDATGNGGIAGVASVDVGIVKTAGALPAIVSLPFDYTLVVANHGPITATGVVVTDLLPANFAFVSATPAQGSCSGTTTVTCNIGTMLNGASVTITIRGTPGVAGPMSNTATVAANEPESLTSNNSSTVAVTVVEEVPALGSFGLMLLALALAVTAAFVMRTRG